MITSKQLANKLDNFESIYKERLGNNVYVLRKYLDQTDKQHHFRINPFQFAKNTSMNAHDAVSLLLCASRIGIFDMKWNLICPHCGFVDYSLDSINSLKQSHYHCFLCNVDIKTELDDWVEITFDLSSQLEEPTAITDYTNVYDYLASNVSTGLVLSKLVSREAINDFYLKFDMVNPSEVLEFEFTPKKNHQYILVSFELGDALYFSVAKDTTDTTDTIYDLEAIEGKIIASSKELSETKTTFRIQNKTGKKLAFLLKEVEENMQFPEKTFTEMFTGKKLINNQTFRELYAKENITKDLSLSLRNITILFTDLKGSTAIYGMLGDLKAYELVNKHFNVLINCVEENNGCVVKTIGDAVMASFNNPISGFDSAWKMNKLIKDIDAEFNLDDPIGIKIGMHTGAALAVNLSDRLDYFGQTVNIAARVQGLANAEEILITQDIYDDHLVKSRLDDYSQSENLKIEKKSALLKGVESSQIVYKLTV